MKNLIFILVLALSFGACTSDQNTTSPDSWNLENLQLNITPFQAKFPVTDAGLKLLLKELTHEVYVNGHEESESLTFYESKGFYILERLEPTENTSAKPCKTESETVTGEDELKALLTKIIGDGKRDVKISYVRNLLSATVSYTYQDC
jgi:hypothetical protein